MGNSTVPDIRFGHFQAVLQLAILLQKYFAWGKLLIGGRGTKLHYKSFVQIIWINDILRKGCGSGRMHTNAVFQL